MPTYCFRCYRCGASLQRPDDRQPLACPADVYHGYMMRDYRAENVGVGSGVRVSRDGTVAEQARLILPDNAQFKGPGDPDGTKGMREWHEKFQPSADNPRPAQTPGRIERRSF
jgi:hypothetical protein